MHKGKSKGVATACKQPATPAIITPTSIRATTAQLRELPAEVFWNWPDPNVSQRLVDALMAFAVMPQDTTTPTHKQSA